MAVEAKVPLIDDLLLSGTSIAATTNAAMRRETRSCFARGDKTWSELPTIQQSSAWFVPRLRNWENLQ